MAVATLHAMKITAKAIKALEIGGELYGQGLHVKKTKKGVTYYAHFNQLGNRVHKHLGKEQTGYNLQKAKDAIIRLRGYIADSSQTAKLLKKKSKRRFSDSALEYVQILKSTGGKNIKQKAQQIDDHLIPAFGNLVLNAIDSQRVQMYQATRRNQGMKPSTVNREIATLNHFYACAHEWGWVSSKPYKVSNLKEDNQKILRFTDDECARLLEAAKNDTDPYSYLFVLVGLNTGMRHGEILGMKFENIDWDRKRLFVESAKAGPRYQPLPPVIIEALSNELTDRGVSAGHVFEADSKTGHRDYMKKQFARIVEAVGLEKSKYTPHVMRHTAITRLIEQGIPIETVRKISGHKTLTMVLRYTHVADALVDDAIESVQIG